MSAEELRAQINEATAPLMPGAESTSARLARVEAERDALRTERTELLSILARIGDALSPTGERPQEALGTLADDVEDLIASLPCGWCGGVGEAQEELFGRDADGAPMVDGPQPCPEGCEVPAWLALERKEAADDRDFVERELTGVRAELASARVEQDHLRAERDAAYEAAGSDDLAAENRVLRARLARAQAQCALPNDPANRGSSS